MLLQRLEPLDVVLERLAAGAGTGGGDGVGRLHEHGLDGLRLHVLVVRLDGVHTLCDSRYFSRAARDDGVRAVDLVVIALPMSCSRPARLAIFDVGAQLGGHDAGEVRDLDGVVEHVLAVARAVLEAPEHLDQLGVQAGHVGVEAGLLAGLFHLLLDLCLGLAVGLLDARRVDAPVGDEVGAA